MDAAASVNMFRRFESRRLASATKRVLPVCLLTGFLGAGKTTLLSHILRRKSNLHVAAAVNDYAELNVDGELVGREAHDGIIRLSSGCFCCAVSEEFEREVGRLLAQGDDMVDYLVVECNGITDPFEAIQSLEKPFGKMTRARLDVVVCVVDADGLLATLGEEEPAEEEEEEEHAGHGHAHGAPAAAAAAAKPSARAQAHGALHPGGGSVADIARGQLRHADVVVLNKIDLVSKAKRARVEEAVRAVAPHATLVPCSFGRVDLTQVLDVSRNDETVGGTVTHETAAATYTTNRSGRAMRKAKAEVKGARHAGAHAHADHMDEDGLVSVAFESRRPLSLARFQDYLMGGLPEGLLRAKGVLWFAEERRLRGAFHLSGSRRLYCFEDGRWESTPSASLILIGRGIDRDRVLADLEALCVDEDGATDEAVAQAEAARAVVRASARFDLHEKDGAAGGDGVPPHVVRFRLTGMRRYEVDLAHIEMHGISLNRVNEAALQAVNFSTGRAVLTPRTLPDGTLVLQWAAGGARALADVWPTCEEEGQRVLGMHFGKIDKCACGR